MSATSTATPLYFGKVPSRGDFVRSVAGSPLIRSIDHWMSSTMDLLAEDARWKLVYDAAAPVHFAIVGSQSRAGLVGHLAVSHDTSGRRFPFVLAASFEVPEPMAFIPYCPQALVPVWARFDDSARAVLAAEDFAPMQEQLVAQPLLLELREDALHGQYDEFTRECTVSSLEAALSREGRPFDLRRAVLALGILLQPVLAQGHAGVNKGLLLPLPANGRISHAVTLWTTLVTPFFARTPAEIAVFVTSHQGAPILIIGFHGASPGTLRSVLAADGDAAENVDVSDAEWVEDWIGTDAPVRQLSSLLRDPSLSLASLTARFRSTFFGA